MKLKQTADVSGSDLSADRVVRMELDQYSDIVEFGKSVKKVGLSNLADCHVERDNLLREALWLVSSCSKDIGRISISQDKIEELTHPIEDAGLASVVAATLGLKAI